MNGIVKLTYLLYTPHRGFNLGRWAISAGLSTEIAGFWWVDRLRKEISARVKIVSA